MLDKFFQFFDDCLEFIALKLFPVFFVILLAVLFSIGMYFLYQNVFNAKNKTITLKESEWACTNSVEAYQPAYPCVMGKITMVCGGYNYSRCTQYTEK